MSPAIPDHENVVGRLASASARACALENELVEIMELLDPEPAPVAGTELQPLSGVVERRLTASENARLAIELEERARNSTERRVADRFWRALMLARDLETLGALLAGEKVPTDRLDPDWLERFARRP